MKKIILCTLVLVSVLFTSCSKDDDSNESPGIEGTSWFGEYQTQGFTFDYNVEFETVDAGYLSAAGVTRNFTYVYSQGEGTVEFKDKKETQRFLVSENTLNFGPVTLTKQ